MIGHLGVLSSITLSSTLRITHSGTEGFRINEKARVVNDLRLLLFLYIPIIITWTHAMQCTTNNEGVMCGQLWCIGCLVGVIDSLRVGRDHVDAFVRAVKKC